MLENCHPAKLLPAGANGGSGLGDNEEDIEDKPEEEGGDNGEAMGNPCILFVKYSIAW